MTQPLHVQPRMHGLHGPLLPTSPLPRRTPGRHPCGANYRVTVPGANEASPSRYGPTVGAPEVHGIPSVLGGDSSMALPGAGADASQVGSPNLTRRRHELSPHDSLYFLLESHQTPAANTATGTTQPKPAFLAVACRQQACIASNRGAASGTSFRPAGMNFVTQAH